MTKPEAYTEEEMALAFEGLEAGGIWAPDDGTTITRHVLRLLATLSLRDARIEELEKEVAFFESWWGEKVEGHARKVLGEPRVSVGSKDLPPLGDSHVPTPPQTEEK